ncbi:MAG: flagellin [Lachnospiraceae bacterium]|nr:flagellin [Lachnospiraceae bacterium]
MKINHNMSAVIANNRLLRNENTLSDAVERLSSGLKINKASDDAAGMAIASKMHAQIKGLDQASQNASDGVSVLETADGAMNEVTAMLQRMRELSVQAANGIYTQEELEAIQAEVSSLTEEIDRISTDTEFNTMKLLDGSLDQRVYLNTRNIDRVDISDAVEAKNYQITVTQDATHSENIGLPVGATPGQAVPEGKVSINGVDVQITKDSEDRPVIKLDGVETLLAPGQEMEIVFETLRYAAEIGEVNLFATADPPGTNGPEENAGYEAVPFGPGTRLAFVSERYGSSAEMIITCDNQDLADYLGIPTKLGPTYGTDAELTLGDGFTQQATYTCDGRDVVVTDRNGFKLSFQLQTGLADEMQGDPVNFEVTEIGTMTLQIGANENQTMDIRIPSISAKALYIDEVDVCSIHGADRAIGTYDKAIAKVGESRSRIGAYQNRLEYAVSSLDATEENMTAALSRIEDADMAEEMTTYTQYNVLTQAATSVLAQANDLPQQALQLLQ